MTQLRYAVIDNLVGQELIKLEAKKMGIKVNKGKMQEAGITKGFIITKVNDEAMKSLSDLQRVVKEASTSNEPVLIIQGLNPAGVKKYFAVQLD